MAERKSINRLRLEFFDMKSGKNESWDSWSARFKEAADKADIASLDGDTLVALFTITGYRGPHVEKIRREIYKGANSDDKKEISVEKATEIYFWEAYFESRPDLYATETQHQTSTHQNNNGKKRNSFQDTKKFKDMVANNRCIYCYDQTCPKAQNHQMACPEYQNLICYYCQKVGKRAQGHVEKACIRKWRHAQRT